MLHFISRSSDMKQKNSILITNTPFSLDDVNFSDFKLKRDLILHRVKFLETD